MSKKKKRVQLKSPEQIANIREAGKYLDEILELMRQQAKPGVSLIEMEQLTAQYIAQHANVRGAFKNYNGYPANLCLSVNDCIVHGIPDKTVLKPGDLLKIDCGIANKGLIADAAVSVVVGGASENSVAASLIQVTKTALDTGLEHIKPHKALFEFSSYVGDYVHQHGFCIVKNLTGHGVGLGVHEAPTVYNYAHHETKQVYFQPGMVLALEPITSQRSSEFVEKPGNSWNLYTKHGDLGAQWEYTIVVTEEGVEKLAGIV